MQNHTNISNLFNSFSLNENLVNRQVQDRRSSFMNESYDNKLIRPSLYDLTGENLSNIWM